MATRRTALDQRPDASEAAKVRLVRLELQGFKSFRDATSVQIRPLTVLAGRNSSGKSSILQPLLLMKQTLEASHDPGALELAGPCIAYTQAAQLLWQAAGQDAADTWTCTLATVRNGPGERGREQVTSVTYRPALDAGVELVETTVVSPEHGESNDAWVMRSGTSSWPSARVMERHFGFPPDQAQWMPQFPGSEVRLAVDAGRVAHVARLRVVHEGDGRGLDKGWVFDEFDPFPRSIVDTLLYLPGLRGMPQRTYPLARTSTRFPGPFPPYVASVLLEWARHDPDRLRKVAEDLKRLGLTWKVEARTVDDTAVEVRVGRLPESRQGGARDLVSIADVGVGTSQALPVVVALHVAQPGQIVHIEQPELHLHPRAQVEMAHVLANAARRGVTVIAETHSSVLLTALQALVARTHNGIDPELVALHWFSRDAHGATRVETAEVGEDGSYGDWPVDFADVEMSVARSFVDAAMARAEAGE